MELTDKEDNNCLIKIENLSFEYHKGEPVLQDINLEINENTINVFLGLNGCGKTTLIKLIAGLQRQTNGTILLNNKPIKEYSDTARSKYIAYVPQNTNNNMAFTVEEFLLLSFTNQRNLLWQPTTDDLNKVKHFIKNLDIDEDKLQKKMCELSGGERQIVIIAGALLQDAKIIILDEPTASLDMKNQYAVLHFLKKCQKENDKTIIFTCHDPNHALRLGGDTIAIHNGKILFKGQSRDIIKAKNLKKIYGESVIDSKYSQYNIITLEDF
ncbi:MAG: ABC transporter ATP-binding protein [Clostridiales bacterium]|jgi:iron complex transport system ATP-binding protein|nr:ABC transporter ATP-binding protein [Clostridiales bacterium]